MNQTVVWGTETPENETKCSWNLSKRVLVMNRALKNEKKMIEIPILRLKLWYIKKKRNNFDLKWPKKYLYF